MENMKPRYFDVLWNSIKKKLPKDQLQYLWDNFEERDGKSYEVNAFLMTKPRSSNHSAEQCFLGVLFKIHSMSYVGRENKWNADIQMNKSFIKMTIFQYLYKFLRCIQRPLINVLKFFLCSSLQSISLDPRKKSTLI